MMPETSLTRAQLVNMALDELLVVGAGQSPDSEDTTKVDSRVDNLFGELSARGIVSVADEAEIPIEWCGPLSELLANECARAFGRERMSDQQREMIEDRLKIIVSRANIETLRLKMDPMLSGGPVGYSLARWSRGS